MRLPFFKSAKPESEQSGRVLITPPRPGGVAPRTTPRSEIALQVRPRPPASPVPPATPLAAGSNGGTTASPVQIPLRAVISQLPSDLFAPGSEAQLAEAVLNIPANLVLPKLRTGRIDITLSDLLPLLPQTALRQPTPVSTEQQTVILPLSDVVAAVPADALAVKHESTLDIDAEGLAQFPNLFDDGLLDQPFTLAKPIPPALPSVAEERPAAAESVEETAEPASQPSDVAPAEAPAPQITPSEAKGELPTGVPETVLVTVRSLVSVLPDYVLAAPRGELSRHADLDLKVAVPVAPILPQLKTARVRLPMETIVGTLPAPLLVSPLPKIAGETVPVPLEEIIPQLPPHVFTAELRQTQEKEIEIDEAEIPTPFAEKGQGFDETQPLFAGTAKAPEPAPAEVAAEITSEEQLADENLAIFTETQPAPAEPPVAEPVVESVPEPVTETAPEPPVAETPATAEPVVEPVVVPTEPSEPVAEPEPLAASVPESLPEPAAEQPPAPESVEHFVETKATRDEAGFLVNLNACTIEDLMRFEGIGGALARRIVEFRNAHGPFKSVEELRAIPGIGRKTFRAIVGVEPRALNQLLGVEHNQELTLQEIVRLTSAIPGVAGCILAMADGLLLTGQLPEHLDQNTISAFAPQLFKKVGRYARELRVGQIRRLTIFTDQQPVSIFQAGEIFLVIIHDTRHFSKALLRRCERISQEIAHLCRQRAVV